MHLSLVAATKRTDSIDNINKINLNSAKIGADLESGTGPAIDRERARLRPAKQLENYVPKESRCRRKALTAARIIPQTTSKSPLRELYRKGEIRLPLTRKQRNGMRTFRHERSLLTFSAALLDPVLEVTPLLAAVFLDEPHLRACVLGTI